MDKLDIHAGKILNLLEDLEESEILTMIVMALEYYTKKYNRDIGSTTKLIKKGYKKYLEYLGDENEK